tara:strand:+ start:473 stop:898 length:426 start_codon:yes stop_codon:yes gene_type:complete
MMFESITVISLGILLWLNILGYIGLNIGRIYEIIQSRTGHIYWVYRSIRGHFLRAIILSLFGSILVSILMSIIYYIKPLDLGFIGNSKVFDIGYMGIVTAIMVLIFLAGYKYNLVLGKLSLLMLLVMIVSIFAFILPMLLG